LVGFDADAEPGSGKFASKDELVGDFFGEAAGDGEADAGVEAADEGVNADDFAVDVHERAAAVAGIDVGVSLDEVLVHGAVVAGNDVGTAFGADVAVGDAVVEIEGNADGDGEFADASFGRIGEFCDGERFGVNFENGDIGFGIDASDRGGKNTAVLEADLDFFCFFNDMAVGEDKAVGTDDYA